MKRIRYFHLRKSKLYGWSPYSTFPPDPDFNQNYETIRYFENKWRSKLQMIAKTNYKRVLDKRLTGKRGTRK